MKLGGKPLKPSHSIKILRIITRLNIGGPAIHAALLNAELKEIKGHPVEQTLLHGSVEGDEGDMGYLLKEGRSIYVPQLRQKIRPWSDLIAFFKIFRHIRKLRPHIVHTHLAKAGLLGRLAAFLLGVPVVIHTYHGHTFAGYFSSWFEKIQKSIEKFLNRKSTAVIMLSPQLKKELSVAHDVVPAELCRVVPLGFHLDSFVGPAPDRPSARKELGLPPDKTIIGAVGRMVPIKNQIALIRSFGNLPANLKAKAHLLLVGDGPEKIKIEETISRENLGEKVALLGWRRDMTLVYKSLDYFVLPSKNEGTPVTVIEAMASGIPVVASRVGGVPDLLGSVTKEIHSGAWLTERGLLFRLENEALTYALTYALLERDQMHSRVKEARRYVVEKFSSEQLIRNLSSLYFSLLRERQII